MSAMTTIRQFRTSGDQSTCFGCWISIVNGSANKLEAGFSNSLNHSGTPGTVPRKWLCKLLKNIKEDPCLLLCFVVKPKAA